MSSGGIFHRDDEHPMDEYTPHKPSSSSSSSKNNSNSDNTTSDASEKSSNDETNENIENNFDNHAGATTTPSKPKSSAGGGGGNGGGKPSLAPPMGFTPSPVPMIAAERHNQMQQMQNGTAPTTPDLLANIARRLGISPSKVESNGNNDVRIRTAAPAGVAVSSPGRDATIDHFETTTNNNANRNAPTGMDMSSPVKSCRTLARGTLSPSSKANIANASNTNTSAASVDDLDLSHMMEAHFDEAGEAATGQLVSDMRSGINNNNNNQRKQQQKQSGKIQAEAKQALVQDAMKRRFATNNGINSGNVNGHQDSLGTPAAPTSRPTNTSTPTIHATPDGVMSTPGSVPSVGLSAMLEGMAPTPPPAAYAASTPPHPTTTHANASSVSYSYEDIAAPTPATVVETKVAGAGAGAGATTMTIPEDSVVHHHGNRDANGQCHDHEGDVSPSKIRFADMMSICEEGEMTTMMDGSEEDANNRSVMSRGVGGRAEQQQVPPSSPSVVNGSHDLSAMCDYVMDGSRGANDANSRTARPSSSAAEAAANDESFLSTHTAVDTVVNLSMARAAVQDESTVYDDVEEGGINDTSAYSEATTTNNDTTRNSSNMIAHATASELDMHGVSVLNHTANTPVGGKSGSRADYSYPESTDSSSSGGSPSGSSSLPSAASYENHKDDMDKSRSDDSAIGCCIKFSREHWFLIATALLCLIGGLVGYGAAFGEWFSASSSSPASSVDSGYAAEDDVTVLDHDGDIVEGDGSDSGNIDIPHFKTGSPTAAPDIPVTTVGDLSFQPKPAPVPRPGTSFAPPTRRPTPAPTNFRGHETFSFYVIGDIPYTPAEEIIVEHQIKNMAVDAVPYLDNEGAQFAVHVGDIMKGGRQADCSKWRYELVENLYKEHCPIPSFMLPGDNDWYDCPNPTAGWSNWMDSFGGMEVHWDGTTTLPSRVQRQSVRRENFAFHHGGVLFIGANLVSKEPYDINANYRKRMNENREWVRQVVQQYRFNNNPATSDQDSIRAIFAFGHHRQSQFWRSLQDDIEDLDVPLIYFHGNGHSWSSQRPFSDWKNVWISQVDMGGIAPPIKVTIQGTTEIARQYPPRKMSPHHIMMGSNIHVDRRGGTIKGPWSTSSFD